MRALMAPARASGLDALVSGELGGGKGVGVAEARRGDGCSHGARATQHGRAPGSTQRGRRA